MPIQPVNLTEHVGDGLAAAAIVTGEGVLALQAGSGDRITDFVRDARRDPSQAGQPLRACDAHRHLVPLPPRIRQSFAGFVERVDDAVKFTLAGARNSRHAIGAGPAESGLDVSHMATPDKQRSTEPRRHQDHQCEQDTEAELQAGGGPALTGPVSWSSRSGH